MLLGLKTPDPLLAQNWRSSTSEWLNSGSEIPGQVECLEVADLTILWTSRQYGSAPVSVVREESRILAVYGAVGPDADGHSGTRLLQLTYGAKQIDGLCGLNGRYQAVVYHEESGRLEFANDTLGLLPFYYCSGKDFFAFGARYYPFRFVPGFEPRLDLRAVGDLLQIGYVIGDRTLYTQARRMPAGAILCCGPDHRVRLTTGARLWFTRENWDTPESELAPRMGEILTKSLRAGADPKRPAIIPLSGGLDSRVVAALATSQQLDCRAVSFGSAYNMDAIIARRVARAMGMEHTVVPFPADAVAAYLPRLLRLTEGNIDATSWYWFALADAVGAHAPSILPGHLGDAASGAHLHVLGDGNQSADSVFDAAFDAAVKKEEGFSFTELAACITPEAFAQFGNATRADSRQVFFSQGEHNFQRILHWDLMLRQRLFICVDMTIEDCAGPVVCPFADINFLRFVASLPVDALRAQHVYREMLKLLAPRLARVTLADSRRPVQASWQEALWLMLGEPEKLLGWRLGKVARRLSLTRRQDYWWATVYGTSPGLDRMLTNSVKQLHGLFQPAFLADLPAIHPGRRRKLALLAKWLECFMSTAKPPVPSR